MPRLSSQGIGRFVLIVHISSHIRLVRYAKESVRLKILNEVADFQESERRYTWSMLDHFTGGEVYKYLCGEEIDSLRNVIILDKNHHDFFGSMCLWFTERPVLSPSTQLIYSLVSWSGRDLQYSCLAHWRRKDRHPCPQVWKTFRRHRRFQECLTSIS